MQAIARPRCDHTPLAPANTQAYGWTMAKKRLSADDWINAGLKALDKHGPGALGAEPLARRVGTTKGSFYWHFKDLPDFHRQLAATWKRQAATALVTALEKDGPVAARLQQIGQTAAGEAAMRVWARGSKPAAREVAEIDKLRLDAMAAVLRDVGISNPDIARALYAAEIGLGALPEGAELHARTMATLIDLVLALR